MAQEKLEKIFRSIADSEGINNYEIHPNVDPLRGNGFLSECYTGEVINKTTGTKIQAYVKVQPRYMIEFTSPAYDNENNFYSKIFPELHKFQIERGVKEPFQNLPKFYCGDNTEDNKYVAMENIQVQNYILTNKSVSMNKEHLRLVFETYGKFHALTFAYKDQNYEKYLKLIKPLKDVFEQMKGGLAYTFPAACKAFKEVRRDFIEKVDEIKENLDKTFNDVSTYKGKYSALTHGDCWSNNMVFKYGESGQIQDMKLLDLQLCRDSTPIHDLSYFFYSAASKEDFQNIEEYLELYHKSFSAFATELGSDPDKLLPLDVLKSEWKTYGLFGILLGIMLWLPKLMKKQHIEDLTENMSNNPNNGYGDNKEAEVPKKDEENGDNKNGAENVTESDIFKENTCSILLHAIDYGII